LILYGGEKIFNKLLSKQELICLVFIFYLSSVTTLYHRFYIGRPLLSEELAVFFFTILSLHIILAFWLLRVRHNFFTLSFALVLLSFAIILIGQHQLIPLVFRKISLVVISFFPVIFLNFFILFSSKSGYENSTYKFFLIIQFILSFIREILRNGTILRNYNVPLFFISLLAMFIFCISILVLENKNMLLWEKSKIKLLILSTLLSITPFVIFTLIPNLFTGRMDQLWSVSFIIILPITLAKIISEENLIIHNYWKISFGYTIVGFILIASIINGIYYFILNGTLVDIFIASHYLLIIFFLIFILVEWYTKKKKKKVQDTLKHFSEDDKMITFYNLKYQLILSTLKIGFKTIDGSINIQNISLFFKYLEKIEVYTDNTRFDKIDKEIILQKARKETTFWVKNEEESFLFIPNDKGNMVIGIHGKEPYTNYEINILLKEAERVFPLLEDQLKLLEIKKQLEDRPYTAMEKNTFLKEMDTANIYNDMISRYLHDDVQQSVLALRQVSYTTDSIEKLREKIENIVELIEESIQEKTIEFEGYPSNVDSILDLLHQLFVRLAIQYTNVNLSKTFNIDEENFLKESQSVQGLLYRAIKELLINVFKHSDATNVTINLEKDEFIWYLSVIDNGIGSDVILENSTRFGLLSLHQQFTALNGSLEVRTQKTKGFKVLITLPIDERID
jgi:signal transduction histidine kinase